MPEVSQNPLYEAKFAAHGASYTLDPDVQLGSMKIVDSAQVRVSSDIAPADQVSLYAIQMQAGVDFPPVVLWNDIILDGNTRIHAARKAGRASLPAYRVDCRNAEHAKDIAAALNNMNGRRLSPLESRKRAVAMLERGMQDAFIARELGVDATKVRRWKKEELAREHAERLGIADELDGISATNRARLGEITHDAPFRALVETLQARDVPSAQVPELLDVAREASSDEEAVTRIAEQAAELPLRGQGLPANRSHRVTAREAYRHLGALLAHPAPYWVDFTETDVAVPKWERLAELAAEVLADYRGENGRAVA